MSGELLEQLRAVYDEHDDLTPPLVLNTARDPDHPLHARFEWDNEVASEAYRLNQARELIRSVRIVYREADETDGPRSVRAFHSVPTKRGHGYVPTDRVPRDPVLTQLVLDEMERDWKALRRRYEHFEEFVRMVRADLGAPVST